MLRNIFNFLNKKRQNFTEDNENSEKVQLIEEDTKKNLIKKNKFDIVILNNIPSGTHQAKGYYIVKQMSPKLLEEFKGDDYLSRCLISNENLKKAEFSNINKDKIYNIDKCNTNEYYLRKKLMTCIVCYAILDILENNLNCDVQINIQDNSKGKKNEYIQAYKHIFPICYFGEKRRKFKPSSPGSLSGEIIIHFPVSTRELDKNFYKNLYDKCENNLKLEDDI